VLGHGEGVLVLGERDCSLQRRHQKVVEEAPAPNLPDRTRAALHEAARAAASAIDYRGAGTVEFLYDAATDRFFFLEMNTRLQVEHPVTELVHGVDLVDLQLTVAEGLPLDARAIGETYGHSIEARLYAEDPAADWQPQSGTLTLVDIPGVSAEFDLLNRPGIRLDSGFETGSEVSTHYDAMLAKVIAWAPTRTEAARRLADALSRARLHGVVTNRDLLVATLRHQTFLSGDVSTDFLALHPEVLARPTSDARSVHVAAALALAEHDRALSTVQVGIPVAWRNVVSQPQRSRFLVDDEQVEVEWVGGRAGYVVEGVEVLEASANRVVLDVDGVQVPCDVQIVTPQGSRTREVYVDGPLLHVRMLEVPRFVDPADVVAQGSLLAPMPGTVIGVPLEAGAPVAAGETVLVLEAMKMQHTISAPADGVLSEITVSVGSQVAAGEVLAVVTPAGPEPENEGDPR
jgi:propionyl-CoA carboxylase alpha chain